LPSPHERSPSLRTKLYHIKEAVVRYTKWELLHFRIGSMLSKNSVVSEVLGGETGDPFFACVRGQLLLGGQIDARALDPTHAYASLGGGPSRRRAMVLRF